jgi:hypothetical protein
MSLLLLGGLLNVDSLRQVMDYLDGIDLSRLECVSLGTKEIVEYYGWETVAKRDIKSPRQLEPSRSLSLKNRVVRWTLTSRYAAKIESSHREKKGPALSQGVDALEADRPTSQDPDCHQHDYFLRLSDGKKCIWEGFAPLVPMDDHYPPYGLDLGTLWEEEGFDWYKEVRKICESDLAYLTDQKLNRTNREGKLWRDLQDLMFCLFKNKRFTFVAVERDLPLTRQFIPKVLVTTKGSDCWDNGYSLCYIDMTKQRVEPARNYEYTNILTTCCHLESFIFNFHLDYEYNYESYGDPYPD